MTYDTVCKLEWLFDKVVCFNYGIGMLLGFAVFVPILLLLKISEWLVKTCKVCCHRCFYRETYLKKTHSEKTRRKYEKRELPMTNLYHSYEESIKHPHYENAVFFFSERQYVIPRFCLVYVENHYDERMHHFFDERQDLLDKWSLKHGWDILFVDKESIKEGMFFPQDYDKHFYHGFLCNHFSTASDPEHQISGSLHSYYEVNPTSDEDILKQIDSIMPKIYKNFDWQIV